MSKITESEYLSGFEQMPSDEEGAQNEGEEPEPKELITVEVAEDIDRNGRERGSFKASVESARASEIIRNYLQTKTEQEYW